MRPVFCWLLLVFFAPVLHAQQLSWPSDVGANKNSASGLSDNSAHLDLRNPGNLAASSLANNPDFRHLRLRNSALPDSFDIGQPKLRRFDRMQSADPATAEEFCAFIRTYQVRREYKGSDVVIPAGQTTCLPSSRFNIRSAVMIETEPPLDK